MSATNATTHYNLPSFLPTDKPAWLVDWNGAMASIDAGIYQAQQSADQSGADISALQNSLTTLSGTVDTQGLTISTLSQSLTTAIGNINTINSLIGNGTPTTTDQTIIGAINEINAKVSVSLKYTFTPDGVKTFKDAVNPIFALLADKTMSELMNAYIIVADSAVYKLHSKDVNGVLFTGLDTTRNMYFYSASDSTNSHVGYTEITGSNACVKTSLDSNVDSNSLKLYF